MKKNLLLLMLVVFCLVFLSGCTNQPSSDSYQDDALKMTIETDDQVMPNQASKMTVYLDSQVPEEAKNVVIGISNPYGLKIKEVDCMNKCKCTMSDNGVVTKTGCNADSSCSLYGQPSNIKSGIDSGCYYKSIRSLDEKEINFALKVPKIEEIEGGEKTFEPELTLEYDYSGESIFYVPILRADMTAKDKKTQLTQSFGPIHINIEKGTSTSKEEWEREGNTFSIVINVEDVVHPSTTDTLKTPTEIIKEDFNVYFSHLYPGNSLSNSEDIGRCDLKKIGNQQYTIASDKITLPLDNPLLCAIKAEDNINSPSIDGNVRVEYSYRYRYVEKKSINLVTELTK